MKSVTSLTFGILASVALANPNYVNTVRQIQQVDGVELGWDVTVAPLGDMTSQEGVGELGSSFELWTLNVNSGQSTFLDSEFVSSFTPGGEVEIVTGDPYPDAPRTRVDKPFTVTMTVEGLLAQCDPTGAYAPLSACRVDFEHRLYNFPEGAHSINRDTEEGTLFRAFPYTANGAYPEDFAQTNLSGDDLTKVQGQEVFSLYSVEDEVAPSELLDEKVLTIWPLAQAEILGVESDEEVSSLPPLTIQLTDLYPDSTTYVRVYQGEQTSEPTDPIEINDADLVIYDVEPQDRTITLTDLGSVMEGGGVWTIEVIHITPWGPESLVHKSPNLNLGIKVRAGLFSK